MSYQDKAKELLSDLKKVRFSDVKNGFVHLIMTTKAEVVIGGLCLASLAGFINYDHQVEAARGQTPVAFSEIGNLQQKAKEAEQTVSPLAIYYGATNDIAMQVFRADNISHLQGSGDNKTFADALSEGLNARMGSSYQRTQSHMSSFNKYADKARRALNPLVEVRDAAHPTQRYLTRAWDESHYDHYSTDSDGNSTYSGTTHTFRYNNKQGQLSVHLLNQFVQDYPEVRMDDRLPVVNRVSDYNQNAMRQSREKLIDSQELTEKDYLDFANVWARGSNYGALLPGIYASHKGMKTFAPLWTAHSKTARSRTYRNWSRSHDGPKEFQTAQKALKHTKNMTGGVTKILQGIDFAEKEMPTLEGNIWRYTDLYAASDYQPLTRSQTKEADQLRENIMETAREIYAKNFSGGFDVYPLKWKMVALWTVIGLVGGMGIGYGVDRYIDHRKNNKPKQSGRWS